jgi:hypothetical protein
MIKIIKIKNGYLCEGANFNLIAFNLTDLLSQLKTIYKIEFKLFTFNLN